MIYTVRRLPFGPPTTWRIEDGVLIENGRKARRWPLDTLRSARIERSDPRRGTGARTLRLAFRNRLVSVGSHSFTGPLAIADQTPQFAAFARAVCAQGITHAPQAQFTSGGGMIGGVFASAAAILGVGLILVVMATLTAGAVTLGLEIAARLAFVLILMLAVWPWLSTLNRRAFNPLAVSRELLP